jgi:hypothetical protein
MDMQALRMLLATAMLLCAGSLAAQAGSGGAPSGPEEPKIELPPVVFEYESIDRQEIDAALPEGGELELPEIEVQLPEPGALSIETPAASFQAPQVGEAEVREESPFFSDGMIGVGLNYTLLGDISLYRRGDGPDFSIGYSHEGLDGYGSQPSGAGYFHRREELNGAVELLEGEERSLRTEVTYTERELGLQDFADASSLLHRFTRAELEFESTSATWGTLGAEFHGHLGSRVTAESTPSATYTDPLRELYLTGTGEWGGRWKWGELTLVPNLALHRGPAGQNRSRLGGEARGLFYFPSADLELSGGLRWDENIGLLYPWRLQLSGVLGSRVHYSLGGGYELRMPSYRELWTSYPLLDIAPAELRLQHGWQAGLELGISPSDRVELGLETSWGAWENYPVPADLGSRDATTGLFPFEQQSLQLADLRLEGRYALPSGLRFEASWDGQILPEYDPLRPRATFAVQAGYEADEGRYGAQLASSWELADEQGIPILDAEAHYRLAEGVVLRVIGSDLLAPLLSGGRVWWGGYIQPGMNVSVRTEISL